MKAFLAALVAGSLGFSASAMADPAKGQSSKAPGQTAVVAQDAPAAPGQIARGEQIARELGFLEPSSLADMPGVDWTGFLEFGYQYLMPGVYGRGGLSLKEREIAVIAMTVIQGTPVGMRQHLDEVAVRAGLSAREVQEVIYTGCFYAGWPKCANAMIAFNAVLKGPNAYPPEKRALAPVPGKDAAVAPAPSSKVTRSSTPEGSLVAKDLPAIPEQLDRGLRIEQDIGIIEYARKRGLLLDGSGFHEFNALNALPGIYGRGGLTFREREIAVLSTIISQGMPNGLGPHFDDVGVRAGLTERDMQEIILTSCFMAGWPKCANAMIIFRKTMDDLNAMPKAKRGLAPVPGK